MCIYMIYCKDKNWFIKLHAFYDHIHYRDKYSDRDIAYSINSAMLILLNISMFALRSISHPSLPLLTLKTLFPRLLASWLPVSFK